ncbi:MAG: 2OG-Fe(II) oxygenase family protein [Paracoccaceae bacterium]|nr:2OG-Fe(II) oxygenase family protein [Paracoccaceae bacterium]
MSQIESLFVTRIYRAALTEFGNAPDTADLESCCLSIAEDDEAGQDWCEKNGYPGYTSYASLADLPWRFPAFKNLVKVIDKHVAAFVKDLQFDLDGKKIKLDSLWINILPTGGVHTSHLHPHSVISGTTYVTMPKGASAIKFEDPRLAMMMAAPARKTKARAELRNFIYVAPEAGEILLWESWLRHEVPLNMADEERISVSFNYGWG